MGNENKKDRARDPVDYDAKLKSMLDDAYCIGATAMSEARSLTDAGRSKGVAGWMHIAEKAIGEIVRLTPMAKPRELENVGQSVGWDYNPELEAELKDFIKTDDTF